MTKFKESNILIFNNALKKIITIFFGPFLTAYFIKVSPESLIDLSIYNIMNYIILGTFSVIVGWIVRNKFQVGMYRIGVISNFIYILIIIILKEKILDHLYLISFLFGFSATAYWYPYNLFASNKISNEERMEYECKKKTVSLLIAIIIPIVLGGIITTTNFELTAIIILIISLFQIVTSFFIKPVEKKNYRFTPIKSFKKMIKDKDTVNILITDYFKGMNISDGALEVVLTILIFNAFQTELNLGILSSISSIFIILMQHFYKKVFKNRDDKTLILVSALIPMITLFILLLNTNNITLVIYYFCYNTFVNVLSLILDIRLFNVANSEIIKDDNEMEFWSIREVILNMGRITGYSLLLIVGILNQYNYLYYIMIFLTLSLPIMGYFGTKIKKFEEREK